METITILQVSDTHLSETHAWFHVNWPVFLDEAARLAPDLVVHSGDVSFNGPDAPGDLVFGRRCLDDMGLPWLAIAGNHDVGEAPIASRLRQPVNDARLAAWRSAIGPSWWCRDLDRGATRLRLVGLDSALMGSAHADEAAQADFLDEALARRDGRPVLVFLHMPPFSDDPDETAITTHCVPPEPRRRLLAACRDGGVAAISAGHIHRYRASDWQGIPVVTAPGTAFSNRPKDKPGLGTARAGYLVWRFDGTTLTHELVEPPMFLTVDAGNWADIHRTTTNLPPRPLAALGSVRPYSAS